MERTINFRFGPTGVLGTSFEGGPQGGRTEMSFLFDKIVVQCQYALLYPAYKNNKQMRGYLGRWVRDISEFSNRDFC